VKEKGKGRIWVIDLNRPVQKIRCRDCQAWATTQATRGRRKHPAAVRLNAASASKSSGSIHGAVLSICILGEMDERGWEGARTGGTVGSASRVRRGRVGVIGVRCSCPALQARVRPTPRPTNPNTNPSSEGGKSIRRRFTEDWHWLYTGLGGERDFDFNTLALGPAPCVQVRGRCKRTTAIWRLPYCRSAPSPRAPSAYIINYPPVARYSTPHGRYRSLENKTKAN
jgi:hypothetical protein